MKYVIFALVASTVAASAQQPWTPQYTQAVHDACMQDALKLCSSYIPDETQVKSCLVANVKILNPICRSAFTPLPTARPKR